MQADLAVIGSGGAAFAAAIRASALGKSVVIVERGTMGGTCVNTGCVPSKALIAAAQARHVAADSGRFAGIVASAGPVAMPALVGAKQALVDSLRAEKYVDLVDRHGWRPVNGDAAFDGTPESPVLRVTAADGARQTVEAEHYVIATGSRPRIPPTLELEGIDYLTSTSAMELQCVPDSLLVLGGGYVALEQAQLFARLGSKVTTLVRSRLASQEEPEASEALEEVFADEGIRVVLGAEVNSVAVEHATGQVVATAAVSGVQYELRADRVLVATGRRPVTDGLNLAAVAVPTGPLGQVLVSDRLATSNPRVWAAGDVTGHREFVYVAAAHGTLVVDNAFLGADRAVDYAHLPRVMFTSPALGSAGLTERQAVAAGIRCESRTLPLEYVPRALVNRDTRGFVKVVADATTGRILGLTAVAEGAGEIAAAGVYLLEARMTVDQAAQAWAPYLTMAEGIKLACQSFSTDVTKLSCCAA